MSESEFEKPLVVGVIPHTEYIDLGLTGSGADEAIRELRARKFFLISDNQEDAGRVWSSIHETLHNKELIQGRTEIPFFLSAIEENASGASKQCIYIAFGRVLDRDGQLTVLGLEDVIANCVYNRNEETERPLFHLPGVCELMRSFYPIVEEPTHKIKISGVTGGLKKEGYHYPALTLFSFPDEGMCKKMNAELREEQAALHKLQIPGFGKERVGNEILVRREAMEVVHALKAVGLNAEEVGNLKRQIEAATMQRTKKIISRDLASLREQGRLDEGLGLS